MDSVKLCLTGKKALVAGDNRFWAKYAAAALSESGADVAIACQNKHNLAAVAAAVRNCGKAALSIEADVTREFQAQSIAEPRMDHFGRIDIVVNSADIRFAKSFSEVTQYKRQSIPDLNLSSVFPYLPGCRTANVKQKKGRIINISSLKAERGVAYCSAYCVSMLQSTRVLSQEWAWEGITVNAIDAGWMSENERTAMEQEDLLLKYIPLKRNGNPGEIGSLLVYLASDNSELITGEFTLVDGAVTNIL
jgi:NAD(P)-dependent dehydrogenase (short-subunit alcohol dehydrogenase family)